MSPQKKKLGELLLELGLIDRDQLTSALAYQRQWGHRLGTSLVAKGFITEGTLTHVLSQALSIPMVDLASIQPNRDALKLIPVAQCESHEMVPVGLEGSRGRRVLTLAMADPLNLNVIEEVTFTTGCKVRPVLAPYSAIGLAIRKWMRGDRVDIPAATYDRPGGPRSVAAEETMTLVQRTGEETQVRPAGQPQFQHELHPGVGYPASAPTPAPTASGQFPVVTGGMGQPASPFGRPQSGVGAMPFGQPGSMSGSFGPFGAPHTQTPGLPPNITSTQGGVPPGLAPPHVGTPMLVSDTSGAFGRIPSQAGWNTPAPMVGVQQGLPPASYPRPQPPPLPRERPAQVPQVDPLASPDHVEELEKKFWALMRVLARKGMITKEEFLKELRGGG